MGEPPLERGRGHDGTRGLKRAPGQLLTSNTWPSSTTLFGMLKAEVIKMFSELRCVMLWFSDMGEVQEGLASAFAAAESSSGVAQPAPGALRRWFQGVLQEVHEGDWGIYPRGHYVTLVCPDAAIEVQSEREEIIYLQQAFRVAQVSSGVAQPALGALRCWLCVNVHCPSSKGRPYGLVARQGVLSQNGNPRMGVGGVLALRAGLPEADFRLHGDLAVALDGLVAIQEDSDSVKPLGGVSDAHELVLVPLVRAGSGVPSKMVPLAIAGRPREGHRWTASPGARRASAPQRGKDPPSKAPGSACASAAQPGQEELVIVDEHEADEGARGAWQDLHQFFGTRFQAQLFHMSGTPA